MSRLGRATVVLMIACIAFGIYSGVRKFAENSQRIATLKDVAMYLRDYEAVCGNLPLDTPVTDWRTELARHIRGSGDALISENMTQEAVRNQLSSVGAILLPEGAWLRRGGRSDPYLLVYWDSQFSHYYGCHLYTSEGRYWVKIDGNREPIDITDQVGIRWSGAIETIRKHKR